MFRRSILSITICIIAIHEIVGDQRLSKPSIFQINHKKPVHAVSDKFLSFTVDPETLLHVVDCESSNATLSIIKGLLPAYLRVAGADSNRLLFRSAPNGTFSSDLSPSTSSKSKNLELSGNLWNQFYKFVASTGLNLIVCLSGGIFNDQTERDLSNTLEFITFSNKNNFNMNWQLGYELQKISRDDGRITGQDVARLRKILEVFPRYQNSLIIGPDVTNLESRENIMFLRNYLFHAQNSLNALTIHPNFTTIQDKDLYDALLDLFTKMETYLWLKEGIVKTASKGVVPKKPIWIAESEAKERECKFSDSMSLIKRLGFSAKLGASVYLRQPHLLSLFEPSPEFWAASLFKALVGRSVLDTRLASGNNSSVVAFSHCTQILEKPEESIINPMIAYERGSITAYGVNTESEPVRLVFKTGIKADETVHMYVLTEDPKDRIKDRIGNTLLNRQHLGLSDESDLPMLSPKIRESAESVVVPAQSIFFLVFPNIRCRACMQQPIEDGQEATKQKIKPSILDEEESMSESSANIPQNVEEPEDKDAVYVSFPKKGEGIQAAPQHSPETTQVPDELKQLSAEGPAIGSKYFTYSDDTWFSSIPQRLKEIHQPFTDEELQNSQYKNDRHLKMRMLRVLGKAAEGHHNVTAEPLPHPAESHTDRNLDKRKGESQIKRLTRISRALSSLPREINSVYQQTRDNGHHAFIHYDPPISDDLEEPNNIPSNWHAKSRKRRDADNSLVLKSSPREVIRIVEELPEPDITDQPIEEIQLSGSTIDKINPLLDMMIDDSNGSMYTRQNRGIGSKNDVSYTTLASDAKIVSEDPNVASSLGPVSPFPRHHPKPTKIKSKSAKPKKGSKSADSSEKESNEGSSSESKVEMRPTTITHADTVENVASNTEMSSSETVAASQTTPYLSSASGSMEDNVAQNKPPASARNSDTSARHEISPKHATNEQVVPKRQHAVTHKDRATAHPTHQKESPVHPIRPRTNSKAKASHPLDDFMQKLKDDAKKLQSPLDPSQVLELAYARAQELLSIQKAQMEERKKRIQEAAKKRHEGRNLEHGRNKRETMDSMPAVEPENSLDQSESDDDEERSARQTHHQRGHTHLHGSTEAPRITPTHLHRSTEASSRISTRPHRSTEAPSRVAPHLHRSTEASSRVAPHLHRSTEAPSRVAPHLQRSTEAPSRVAPHLHSTDAPKTVPVPRRERPIRKQFQVPQRNTLSHVTSKSPLADKHRARLHQHDSKLDRHQHDSKVDRHQLRKRDLLDDLFSKVKHVYDDVSTKVQKDMAPVEKWVEEHTKDVKHELAPVEKWVEERAKDVKHEFEELQRSKRDLGAFKEKMRERHEKIHQKIEEIRQRHRIHVRNVESLHRIPKPAYHFDEKIKDNQKRLHHAVDPIQKMQQERRSREHKLAGQTKHKLEIPAIEPSRRFVRSLNNSLLQDEHENISFDEDLNIVVFPSDFNESSVEMSGPHILGNFSDILSPPEKKSAANESQCDKFNFFEGFWCEASMFFSKLLFT